MAMYKQFNITGPCVPALHYMVDTSDKIKQIINEYISEGEYFTMNRARQYGKTTTLGLLEKALTCAYIPVSISFEGFSASIFSSENRFIQTFVRKCAQSIAHISPACAALENWKQTVDDMDMSMLGDKITQLAQESDKKFVLMIDEVDKSSNNQLFLDFLGMLRSKYIERTQRGTPTFHSVILAGIHDIKNLKMKLRPDDKHSYNSPWNIAANFEMDMSFSASEIVTMLCEYERDYHTGMNIVSVAERIYYYTSGYPFLVSLLCKTVHDDRLDWTSESIDEAKNLALKSNNTLFDDVIKNLINHSSLNELVRQVINGAKISFQLRNPEIDMGLMYGIIKEKDNYVAVSSVIFESLIFDYNISINTAKPRISAYMTGIPEYILHGRLNMPEVLNRFAAFMRSEYWDEDGDFIEREGRLLFLSFLKPIINGTGHYVVEPETRGNRRMDVVVFYGGAEHIVELKIWRGEQAASEAYEQLTTYLISRGQRNGYLLSFCDNKKAPRAGGVFTYNGFKITEVIVAYRDKE